MFKTTIINGISEIVDKYDYYIIDLWGVLHDGTKAYPNALEALKYLHKNKKKVILLSNAPRRSRKALDKLNELGFTKDLYDYILTSGEVTYKYAKNEVNGKNFFYIGPEKDRDLLDGAKKQEVAIASEANFALATGFEGFGSLFEEKKPQLDECLEAGLTMLCANPDRKVVNQKGEVQICSGLMAEYYKKNGGKVEYFGKPFPRSYQECKYFFGSPPNEKICCIGDSFHTDIEGGNRAGTKTLLIAGGIYKDEINDSEGNIILDNIYKLVENKYQRPNFVASEFKV